MARSPAVRESSSAGAPPAIAGMAGLPADLIEEGLEHAGAGVSREASDNVVPFMSVLQDMSPQVKKRDPKYVEGAEPGCLYNPATGTLYRRDADTGYILDASGQPLEVQPCAFQRLVAEWIPRSDGGGFVGRHPLDGSFESTVEKLGARAVKDADNPRRVSYLSDDNHQMVDTRYHFTNIIGGDGTIRPVVFSFASTGHGVSRAWMTLMNEAALPDGRGGRATAPSWFKKYRVRSVVRSNNDGEWFVLEFRDCGADGWIADRGVRAAGLQLHESVTRGTVQAAAESDDTGGSRSDVPI